MRADDTSSDATPASRLILLATDGSDQANAALAAGLRIVGPARRCLLVTVVQDVDPFMVVGSGHAGPVMTPSQEEVLIADRDEVARSILDEALTSLSDAEAETGPVETLILRGNAGDEICRHAAEHDVDAIVLGTSGRGGLKRALLGSVSDHIVRHAPCPVLTVNTA